MKISLESIGLKNICLNSFSFDYSQQGEFLQKLLQRKENDDVFHKMLERAKTKNPEVKENWIKLI